MEFEQVSTMDLQSVRQRLSGLPRKRGKHLCKSLRLERDALLQRQQELLLLNATTAVTVTTPVTVHDADDARVAVRSGHIRTNGVVRGRLASQEARSVSAKMSTKSKASGTTSSSSTSRVSEDTTRLSRELIRLQQDHGLFDRVKQRLEERRLVKSRQCKHVSVTEDVLSWCDTSRGSSDDGLASDDGVDVYQFDQDTCSVSPISASVSPMTTVCTSSSVANSVSPRDRDFLVVCDLSTQQSTQHGTTPPELLLNTALSGWSPLCRQVFFSRW